MPHKRDFEIRSIKSFFMNSIFVTRPVPPFLSLIIETVKQDSKDLFHNDFSPFDKTMTNK